VTGHLETLDLDEAEGADATDATAAPRAWVRRRTPWLLAAAGLALAGLLGAQSLIDAREHARLASLADVPGVLRPLHEPVGTLWHWGALSAPSLVAGDTAGRWAIAARYHPGSVDLRGTNPDTGAVVWTTPFSLTAAIPAGARDGFPSVWVRCAPVADASGTRAVCGAEIAPVGVGEPPRTPLLVVDPTDGRVLATHVLPAGSLWSVTGGLLLVAQATSDDAGGVRWDLRATDPVTGAQAWHRSTPTVPQVDRLPIGTRVVEVGAALTSDDHRVLLTDSGHAWLFGADGVPRGDLTVATDGWADLARGDTVVWNPYGDVAVPSGILVTGSGERVPVGGTPARLSVDDGSAPDVVLLTTGAQDATLVARDARTGAELWRADASTDRPIVVDGTVYSTGPTSVVARDARTGHERWHVHLDAEPLYLGSDPQHVVVLTDDRSLHALDLTDGHLSSAADVSALLGTDTGGVDQATEYAGRLVIRFQDGSGVAVG